jgi:hypothetical protein
MTTVLTHTNINIITEDPKHLTAANHEPTNTAYYIQYIYVLFVVYYALQFQ